MKCSLHKLLASNHLMDSCNLLGQPFQVQAADKILTRLERLLSALVMKNLQSAMRRFFGANFWPFYLPYVPKDKIKYFKYKQRKSTTFWP